MTSSKDNKMAKESTLFRGSLWQNQRGGIYLVDKVENGINKDIES